jgi:hypothetical protein
MALMSGGGRAAATGVAGACLAFGLSACGGTAVGDAVEAASYKTATCDDLAKEAVRISEKQDVQLLKVRSAKIVTDNRKTVAKPSGDKAALVLSCRGTGVWSDAGDNSPVLLKLTIDSDGEQFVEYAEQ